MANWKELLSKVLLADGVIDDAEAKLLKVEFYEDGVIDEEEMMFLIGLRKSATKTCKEFETFFFQAFESSLLEDGVIDAYESELIRTVIFEDGKIDANEKKFLEELKQKAKDTDKLFEKLCLECGV